MDTLNTNSIIYTVAIYILLYSCSVKKNETSCLPLYHFDEEICFEEIGRVQISRVFFLNENDSLIGNIEFVQLGDSTHCGRIRFESITDTICKEDSIVLEINKSEFFITEIEQKYVLDASGVNKPAFLEYRVNGVKYRNGIVL